MNLLSGIFVLLLVLVVLMAIILRLIIALLIHIFGRRLVEKRQVNGDKEINNQNNQQTSQDQLTRIESLVKKAGSNSWIIATMSSGVTAVVLAG